MQPWLKQAGAIPGSDIWHSSPSYRTINKGFKSDLMTRSKVTLGNTKTLALRSVRRFVASMSGDVIIPGDHRYGGARRVWNHAVDVHPAIIARCANSEDVVRAVEFARDHGLLPAIRSGGHSFAGHGVCEAGMVIDLCPMKHAEIDPLGKTI